MAFGDTLASSRVSLMQQCTQSGPLTEDKSLLCGSKNSDVLYKEEDRESEPFFSNFVNICLHPVQLGTLRRQHLNTDCFEKIV